MALPVCLQVSPDQVFGLLCLVSEDLMKHCQYLDFDVVCFLFKPYHLSMSSSSVFLNPYLYELPLFLTTLCFFLVYLQTPEFVLDHVKCVFFC